MKKIFALALCLALLVLTLVACGSKIADCEMCGAEERNAHRLVWIYPNSVTSQKSVACDINFVHYSKNERWCQGLEGRFEKYKKWSRGRLIFDFRMI